MTATDDARSRELRSTFRAELDERVPVLNQLMLRLEKSDVDPATRRELLAVVWREVHTLKGAARAVELPNVERLIHAMESALQAGSAVEDRPADTAFVALFQSIDALSTWEQPTRDWAELIAALESGHAPPAMEALTGPTRGTAAPAESVRVAVKKLDTLLALSGELAVTQIRIEQRQTELRALRNQLVFNRRQKWSPRSMRTAVRASAARRATAAADPARDLDAFLPLLETAQERAQQMLEETERVANDLRRDSSQLRVVTRAIEDEVMAIRLVPTESLFRTFERMIRDLAKTTRKEVRLILGGTQTEIDRKILEQLRDPLMHMLRNAVDHGIELPETRLALGKPAYGTLGVSAEQRGGIVVVKVEDDGAGLDPRHLRATAVRKGMLTEEQAEALGEHAARELIFRPGFSTTTTVSEISGRGVGMDVVRTHVERLGGHIAVGGALGKGSSFTISVPLTLATTRAILAELDGQVFAIPSATIERSARLRIAEAASVHGRRVAVVDGHPLPIVELADVLNLAGSSSADEWRSYFVLCQGHMRVGLLVDVLIGEQQLLVKRLGWPVRRARNIEGGAVLSSGETVIILNPSDLLKSAWQVVESGVGHVQTASTPEIRKKRTPRLLVVDDSLTTRTLERAIFEAAGYEVVVASDGVEALSRLHEETVDIVVSDVEMPLMDGFALTAAIRRDDRVRHVPVVLVTSLEAREHRQRGAAVGADAYIVKSRFDQGQLLDIVGRLIAA